MNSVRELFSKPPAPGTVCAIAKVNLEMNHKYIMKSVKRLCQHSLNFFCLFLSSKLHKLFPGKSETVDQLEF